jgi:FKBP-type peptidyl-prolyl cis-trans isomerase (trigger factor)
VQERIQTGIFHHLAKITSVKCLPNRLFEEFARTRYERELMDSIQQGEVAQDEVERLTAPGLVSEYIEQERDRLTKEFRIILAMDEIFKLEKLSVDEELVKAEAASSYKVASADMDVTVRDLQDLYGLAAYITCHLFQLRLSRKL